MALHDAYRSRPLAALLDVFALWNSGEYIVAIARGVGLDLDATAISALTVLGREGRMRPSQLAHALRVGASNVSKISARLGVLGLVQKAEDSRDSRATLISLTPAGEAAAASLVAAGDAMMAEILADWSPADQAAFTELLRRFEGDALHYAASLT